MLIKRKAILFIGGNTESIPGILQAKKLGYITIVSDGNIKSPSKKIFVYKNNKKKIYDGYAKKNQKTIKLLLDKFYNVNKINDINTNLKVYELLFKIKKQLQIK